MLRSLEGDQIFWRGCGCLSTCRTHVSSPLRRYEYMDNLRRIVNNTIISLIGQAVTWTSTFILTIAYGRFLGASKFGELYFASSFVMLFVIIIEYGFNIQLNHDVVQQHDRVSSDYL